MEGYLYNFFMVNKQIYNQHNGYSWFDIVRHLELQNKVNVYFLLNCI